MPAAKPPARNRTRAPRKKQDWAPLFLQILADCPDVSKAAKAAGIPRSTAYRRRQADEDFALAWADAHAKSLDELEAALFTRARETDTTAAIFLLKSHRPEIYAERYKLEHSGTIKREAPVIPDEPDRRRKVAALLDAAGALQEAD